MHLNYYLLVNPGHGNAYFMLSNQSTNGLPKTLGQLTLASGSMNF